MVLFCRAKTFRQAFGKLHTLRAFLKCPFVGLSATLTTEAIGILPDLMGMVQPTVFKANPDRPNIFLEKRAKPSNRDIVSCAESIFLPYLEELYVKGDDFPVTLLYMPIPWISQATIYALDIFDYPDLYSTPFVSLLSSQDQDVVQYTIEQLKTEDPHIRLVFCTSSVGMGFDSPCVSRVVHAKPPRNITDYIQQIGRAGRVGQPSTAVLYCNASDIASNVPDIQNNIITYCKTSGCLRKAMLQPFGFECVDIQSGRCCSNCNAC